MINEYASNCELFERLTVLQRKCADYYNHNFNICSSELIEGRPRPTRVLIVTDLTWQVHYFVLADLPLISDDVLLFPEPSGAATPITAASILSRKASSSQAPSGDRENHIFLRVFVEWALRAGHAWKAQG
jgi:hypothetical protein